MGFNNAHNENYQRILDASGMQAEIDREAAEKKARIEAEGDRLARERAAEADMRARRAARGEAALAQLKAEKLARYREQRAAENPAAPSGPISQPRPARTLYSEQAQLAADGPAFGAITPLPAGQVRGLNGVSLKSLMEGSAPAAKS